MLKPNKPKQPDTHEHINLLLPKGHRLSTFSVVLARCKLSRDAIVAV